MTDTSDEPIIDSFSVNLNDLMTTRLDKTCESERRHEMSLFGRPKCGPYGRFFEQRHRSPPGASK